MRRVAFFLIFLAAAAFLKAAEFPALQNGELPGLQIVDSQEYRGSQLYGYINGGSELYYEYGFESVLVQTIRIAKSEYQAEYYRMTNPTAAFGIFSVSRRPGRLLPEFSGFGQSTRFQTLFAVNQFYVSVTNFSGTAADSQITVRLARKIAGKIQPLPSPIPEPVLRHPEWFPPERLWMVAGPLGLQGRGVEAVSGIFACSGWRLFGTTAAGNKTRFYFLQNCPELPGVLKNFEEGPHGWKLGSSDIGPKLAYLPLGQGQFLLVEDRSKEFDFPRIMNIVESPKTENRHE